MPQPKAKQLAAQIHSLSTDSVAFSAPNLMVFHSLSSKGSKQNSFAEKVLFQPAAATQPCNFGGQYGAWSISSEW